MRGIRDFDRWLEGWMGKLTKANKIVEARRGRESPAEPGGAEAGTIPRGPGSAEGAKGSETAPFAAGLPEKGEGKLYLLSQVVMCELCFAALTLWERNGAEVTYVHPEFQKCSNVGKRFTFTIPSVEVK